MNIPQWLVNASGLLMIVCAIHLIFQMVLRVGERRIDRKINKQKELKKEMMTFMEWMAITGRNAYENTKKLLTLILTGLLGKKERKNHENNQYDIIPLKKR